MSVQFSESTNSKINEWVSHFPKEHKRAALIPILTIVQEEFGSLTEELKRMVADRLEITPTEVQEIITFYTCLKDKKLGKKHFKVCTTLSCAMFGGENIIAYLKESLGVEENEVTPDGEFSFERVECLASCDTAPVMMLGLDYHENVTKDRLDALLKKETQSG